MTPSFSAARIKDRFNQLLLRVQAWSKSPYVLNVIADPNNRRRVNRLNQAFLDVVESDSVLQTFNLLDTEATCIASSIPSRIGLQEMQDVVSRKDDFQAATHRQIRDQRRIYGHIPAVGPLSPCVFPYTGKGKWTAYYGPSSMWNGLAAIVLKNLWAGQSENVFVFSPELDLNQYAGHDFTLVMETPYEPPSIPPGHSRF